MVDAIENCRAVTLAVVQGGVYGGATDMVLACDFRMGSHTIEMFMPAARLGLHYYLSGLERYVSRLGVDMAKRLFLTAEKLNAQQMKDCGFLTHLVAPEALQAQSEALCQQLATMAPLALLGMKYHLNRIARGAVDAQAVRASVLQTLASQDLKEGGLAWQEKRTPRFTGR
jgi:enoyl-CoA hydratase/carnithine racemase